MRQNLNEINITRAIACIFVVMTHSITNYIQTVDIDMKGAEQYIVWYRFMLLCATPIFILLSETLIAKNYPNGLKKGFFTKRIQFILVPYLLIGAIFSYRLSDKTLASFLEIAYDKIILGNWYGFFVIVIFQFYVLHWLIGKFLSKINPILPLLIAFAISFFHSYGFTHSIDYKELVMTEYPLFYRTNIFLWLFYFVAGFYIGQYYDQLMAFFMKRVWLPIALTVLTFGIIMYNYWELGYTRVESERYDILLYAVSVFFMLVVLIRKYEFYSKPLMMLSNFSFFIYLTHKIILPYLGNLTLSFGENFFIYVTIMTFLTLSTSIGWAFLYYQFKPTRLFTGKIQYLEEKKIDTKKTVSQEPLTEVPQSASSGSDFVKEGTVNY